MCVYFGHPNTDTAVLTDRAAFGFADGLPNVFLIPDVAQGLYRPIFQLEDLVNQTGKSYIFSERTFSRTAFKAAFRDLGCWTPNHLTYLKANALYQFNGRLPTQTQLSHDDVLYLKSIQLTLLITLDESNLQPVCWSTCSILNCNIPSPPNHLEEKNTRSSSNMTGTHFAFLAFDVDCCSAYGTLLRAIANEVGARPRNGTNGQQGIMFGCSGSSGSSDSSSSSSSRASRVNTEKVAWAVALLYMALGLTTENILHDFKATSRSLREYGGSDVGRSVVALAAGLNGVLGTCDSFTKYLTTRLHVPMKELTVLRAELVLPMMKYSERKDTTKHDGF